MTNEVFHIAIDGPVASGKGTLARALAKRFGVHTLDTGAFYRALGVWCKANSIDVGDKVAIERVIASVDFIAKIDKAGMTLVLINGEDMTGRIRTAEAGQLASKISVHQEVKTFLTKKMQNIAKEGSFMLEGRDITSVVLRDAKFKFYLTADTRVRAKRRLCELEAKGMSNGMTLEEMEQDIKIRDERDMSREAAPLRIVEDAIIVDNSNMTMEETVEHIYNIVRVGT